MQHIFDNLIYNMQDLVNNTKNTVNHLFCSILMWWFLYKVLNHLKGPLGASRNQIVRPSICPFVCLLFCLAYIQNAIFEVHKL